MANNVDLNTALQLDKAKSQISEMITLMKGFYEETNKFNTAVTASSKAEEALLKVQKQRKTTMTEAQKLATAQIAITKKLIEAESGQAKALATSKAAYTAKNKVIKDAAKASILLTTAEKNNTAAQLLSNKAIETGNKALKINITSKESAKAQTSLLRQASEQLDLTTKKGIDTQAKWNAQINKNTEFIKKNSDTQSQGKQTVGQYTESVKKAITELTNESVALKNNAKFQESLISSTKQTITNQNKLIKSAKTSKTQKDALIKSNKTLIAQQDKLQSEYKQTNSSLAAANAKLKELGAAQNNSAAAAAKQRTAMIDTAKTMVGYTGGAAAAMMALRALKEELDEAIQASRTFGKEFANVLTLLTEADKAEFKLELEEGSIDTMKKYGLSIEDTNKALFDAVSAGIEAGDAIEFLDKAALTAVAGNSELSDVVDGATTVLENYKGTGVSTTEVLNAFFAAQVKGKTTVNALATNIGKVASTAAAADIPMNELFGTMAGLTKGIGSTEEASTALVNVINSVIKPSIQAKKVFDELGIETGITAVKQSGLLSKVLEVSAAYEGNNDVLAKLIPNIRAFKGIAALTPAAISEISTNIDDLSDSEKSSMLVQSAFNEQMATGAKQAEVLEAAQKGLYIELGRGDSVFTKLGKAWRTSITGMFDQTTDDVRVLNKETTGLEQKVLILSKTFVSLLPGMSSYRDLINETTESTLTSTANTNNALNNLNETYLTLEGGVLSMYSNTQDAAKENTEVLTLEEIALQNKLQEIRDAAKDSSGKGGSSELSEEEIKAAKDAAMEIISIDSAIYKAKEELISKKTEATQKANKEILDDAQKVREEIHDYEYDYDELDLKLEEDHAAKIKEISDQTAEDKKKAAKDARDFIISMQDQVKEATIDGGAEILNTVYGSQLEEELAKKEDAKDAEIAILDDKLDKGVISEDDYAKEVAALELKYRQDEAKAEKKAALFSIAINTAAAVAKALPNVPLSIATAALGAIQAGVVLATPIPQYRHGTKDHKGGFAEVGDGGEHELIRLPSGLEFMSPNKSTFMNLPKGTQVLNPQQYQKENNSKKSIIFDTKGIENRLDKLNKKQNNGLTARQLDNSLSKMGRSSQITTALRGK